MQVEIIEDQRPTKTLTVADVPDGRLFVLSLSGYVCLKSTNGKSYTFLTDGSIEDVQSYEVSRILPVGTALRVVVPPGS